MTLKSQILPHKVIYLIFVIIAFSFFVHESSQVKLSATNLYKLVVSEKSLLFSAITLAVLIFEGLIPAGMRDKLVHLRLRDPLPGNRAFSHISPKDNRIDLDFVEEEYGEIPSAPSSQNKLFYKLYKTVSDKPSVLSSHKRYLLTRDIATITYLLIVPATLIAIMSGSPFHKTVLIFLIGAFLAFLFSWLARNYSHRFITNSLALSTNPDKKNKV